MSDDRNGKTYDVKFLISGGRIILSMTYFGVRIKVKRGF